MFLAACGLGMVEVMIVWNKGSATLVDPVMFVIVIGALLFQRRSQASRASRTRRSRAGRTRPTCARSPASCCVAARGEVGPACAPRRVRRRCWSRSPSSSASATPTWRPRSPSTPSSPSRSCSSPGGRARSASARSRSSPSAPPPPSAANVHWDLDPFLSFLLAAGVGAVASVIIGLPALRIRGLMLAVTHARVRGRDAVVPPQPRREHLRHLVRLPARQPHRPGRAHPAVDAVR